MFEPPVHAIPCSIFPTLGLTIVGVGGVGIPVDRAYGLRIEDLGIVDVGGGGVGTLDRAYGLRIEDLGVFDG